MSRSLLRMDVSLALPSFWKFSGRERAEISPVTEPLTG